MEENIKKYSFSYVEDEQVVSCKSTGYFCGVCRHLHKDNTKNMIWFKVHMDKGRDHTLIVPLCIDCVKELKQEVDAFLEQDKPMRDELMILNS